MKKKLFYIIGAVTSFFIFIAYILFNPPLNTASWIFHGKENKMILIPMGNKGIAKIKNI